MPAYPPSCTFYSFYFALTTDAADASWQCVFIFSLSSPTEICCWQFFLLCYFLVFVFHFRLLLFVLFACTAYSVVSVCCLPNAWLPSLVFVCLLHASNLNGWIIFLFVSFCFSSCATHFLYIYRCCNSTMLGVYSYAAAAARCQGFAPALICLFIYSLFLYLFLYSCLRGVWRQILHLMQMK